MRTCFGARVGVAMTSFLGETHMPLYADVVGHRLPEQRLRVTPRMALAYAAGIGDQSSVCADDMSPGFMAHPAFCVSPEWRLVLQNRMSGMGLTPDETMRGVHAGQNSRFFSPIRPGSDIRVTGEVVEVRGTKAGALVRTRLEIEEAETAEPLCSTLTTALYRGVAAVGAASAADSLEDVTETWSAPATSARVTLPLDRMFAHRYSECADIWNPIHTERRAALAAGLPDIIVHGTALWALAGRELIGAYTPDEPQRLKSLNGRFSAMVIAGEPITIVHGKGSSPGEVMFSVLNAAGEEAVSRGVAHIG